MKAFILTAEQAKNDKQREYNPQAWEQRIDDYLKYENVEFYKVPADDVYSYDRFYVIYTLPEGIRLMNTLSYSSSITSGGFTQVFVSNLGDDLTFFEDPNEVRIRKLPIRVKNDDGVVTEARIGNHNEARAWMAQRSREAGAIFTKEM